MIVLSLVYQGVGTEPEDVRNNMCENAGFLLRIVVKLVKYMHIIVPVILVLMITFDLAKSLTGPLDDKMKKEVFNRATKRAIYAAIVFLIPTLINFIFQRIDPLVGDSGTTNATTANSTSWLHCWNYYYDK